MAKLLYLSLMRLPTEKAHGLQIVQNCEALANAGYEVELWVANRRNTPEMQAIADVYAYYGIANNFKIRTLPVLDTYRQAHLNPRLERIAFYLVLLTYLISMLFYLLHHRADVYYSRDEYLLYVLSFFFPAQKLAYEAHLFASTGRGTTLQKAVLERCHHCVVITKKLKDDFITQYGIANEKILVAHDGIRAARFADLPDKLTARQHIGWQQDAFIVGFVGRLHMLNVDKGVGTLIAASAPLENVSVALVGGPDEMATAYRQQWLEAGRTPETFLYAGHVTPDEVPLYMSAFDVCAMPHPFTTQYAYYTSPLKLFEYMASGRAIVASDLPGWADVLQHEKNALRVSPSDIDALRKALVRLGNEPSLRETLAENARRDVLQHYTWAARATRIQAHLQRNTP